MVGKVVRVLRGFCVIAVGVAALLPAASLARGGVKRCPAHSYWDNIRVHNLSCAQAVRLQNQKLRDCGHPKRTVTSSAYVYVCRFGWWTSTERVGRQSFSDRVDIERGHGRAWLRYDALP